MAALNDMDARARAIFKQLVETYLDTGQPVGSRTLSRIPALDLSPATIRNVMSDLAAIGLLDAPHASAGRMPTDLGLRLFVDGLMEVGAPSAEDRRALEDEAGTRGDAAALLDRAASQLSGLTQTATMIVTDKADRPLKHVSFVPLDDTRALMVLVDRAGDVENRILTIPAGLPASALIQAANFLNAQMAGRTLQDAERQVSAEIEAKQGELDSLTTDLVKRGIAELVGRPGIPPQLIIRGQAHLIQGAETDLGRLQKLFIDLERRQGISDLLSAAKAGEGVRIFIGAENPLFSLSGSSVIASPYRDSDRNIIGVIGVVGPTRLNYGRVIPLVDYTAEVVSRMMR
ncbi:heat-inducible transcriptional repressor HrcA [Parvularcula sp. LCG005]|uniref:heat-inducible transcriptional repressor HrcA n=1 Tax=Parvularcula sp. LCG005 TaxID=3078805 RepID=UPI002942AAC4|nr:heat-inducible transcriptional repressor HrcA [Parvularcula sp. LCG005]WOI53374.1 heat-inducible transcriptional repressor HrcA [Parvularcula sp. LCG005]